MLTVNHSEEFRCLADILTCLICRNIVSQAHICPNCSKFYCYDCIIDYLNMEQKCLYCKKLLQAKMLVNCQKLCQELYMNLEKVHPKEGLNIEKVQTSLLFCKDHELKKTYYCKTCDSPLCSDCSVLTQKHCGHQFIKLSIISHNYQEWINQNLYHLKNAKINGIKQLDQHQKLQHSEKSHNSASHIKFQNSMNNLKDRIAKKLMKIEKDCQNKVKVLNSEVNSWNCTYQSSMKILKESAKGRFIEEQYTLLERQINHILNNIERQQISISQLKRELNQNNQIISFIHPEFSQCKFIIHNYTNLIEGGNYFYTEIFIDTQGLRWRLKIYPNGIQQESSNKRIHPQQLIKKYSKNEDYLAIFIEFVDGYVNNTKQKHKISLVNQIQARRMIQRQFQSQFDVGECWGYDHYIKLRALYEEGFIHPDGDYLEIVLKICPFSYYQAALDQSVLLKQKQQTLNNKENIIEQLQNWFNKKDLISTGESIKIEYNYQTSAHQNHNDYSFI